MFLIAIFLAINSYVSLFASNKLDIQASLPEKGAETLMHEILLQYHICR